MTRAAVPRLVMAVVLALVCGTVLVAAFGFAGPLGLVIAADCLAVPALVIILARSPGGESPHPGWFFSEAVSWVTRGRLTPGARRPQPLDAADFPAYLKISSDLGWAAVSRWHFDHGIRPLLIRLTRARLADHHRLDPAADPRRARSLLGEDLWPLVDPSRPPSLDSHAPGPGLATLTAIVDRLEQL